MKVGFGRIYEYVVFIQVLFWISATTSRPFSPNNNVPSLPPSPSSGSSTTYTLLHSSQPPLGAPESSSERMEVGGGAEISSKIGSSPPSCEHKCYGCFPCEAIQVPTTKSRVGVMYANYEPEGWKCKCGPSFYSP